MEVERHSDIAIIGTGPVALFSVFQLGLFGLTCRLFDSASRAGGQCTALYADKPIFDVPAFAKIMGEELIERLLTQIAPYKPAFEFDQLVTGVSASEKRYSAQNGHRNNIQFKMPGDCFGPWGIYLRRPDRSPRSACHIGLAAFRQFNCREY